MIWGDLHLEDQFGHLKLRPGFLISSLTVNCHTWIMSFVRLPGELGAGGVFVVNRPELLEFKVNRNGQFFYKDIEVSWACYGAEVNRTVQCEGDRQEGP